MRSTPEETTRKVKALWGFYEKNKNASIDAGQAHLRKLAISKSPAMSTDDAGVVRDMARFGVSADKFLSLKNIANAGMTLEEFLRKNGGNMSEWPWPKLLSSSNGVILVKNGAKTKVALPAGIRPIHRKHPKKKPRVTLSEVREKATDVKVQQELSTGDFRVSRLISVPVRQIQAVLADQHIDHIEIHAGRMVIWPLPPGPIVISMD